MAETAAVCGVCEHRQISKPSIVWCTDCDEGLCAECTEHHSLLKITRSHRKIPISEYQKLPSYVLKIQQFCEKHNQKYQIFCKKHDRPCCSQCIVESHNECKEISSLADVIQNVKTSTAFQEIEQMLTEVVENVQRIRKDRKENLKKIKEERKKIEKEIQDTRMKVNNFLDKLQDDLMKELLATEENASTKICQLLRSLEEKEKELNEYKINLANIKQHATDLQTFLTMKRMENDVSDKDKYIQSLVTNNCLNQTTVSCKIDTYIGNLLSNVKRFGEVVVDTKPCELTIIRQKIKQAQMMVANVPSRSIDNITLQLVETINTRGKNVRGCCLLPDGRMVFSCYISRSVFVINTDRSKIFKINLQPSAFDVSYIEEDNIVVVTSGGNPPRNLNIINVEDMTLEKTISLDSYSYGIVPRNKTLIYCASRKGLRMINLNNESINGIISRSMAIDAYVTTFEDKLYYTNRNTHTVTCCDLQGKTQWEFKNENVLKGPLGISVDNNGNVYVVGCSSVSVVVISCDGQNHRQLLSAEDGLIAPCVLFYDKSTNQLLVANCSSTAFLFNITS